MLIRLSSQKGKQKKRKLKIYGAAVLIFTWYIHRRYHIVDCEKESESKPYERNVRAGSEAGSDISFFVMVYLIKVREN